MADKKSVQIMVAQPTDKQLYSQWERQTSNKNSSKGRKQISFSARTESATLTASTGQTRADRQQTGSVTKLPAHSRQTTSKEEKEERIRLLELKTASTRKAIANHREREKELIKENLMMKQSIQATERPDHEAVKKLMRRYEKFRGGISFLNENFTTTLQKEESGLRALERRLEVELGSIQQQVDGLDERLQRQQNQVYILNNYKDKEYPVKAIRIGELMTELDEVELENDDEFFDLERVIDNELDKLNNAGNDTELNIKESALNSVLDQMHPSLREMAKQNQVMMSEIDYHRVEIVKMQDKIVQLEQEVQHLISQPQTNVRLQVFPELFKYDTKCTPDMDVVLDIPKVELLPI